MRRPLLPPFLVALLVALAASARLHAATPAAPPDFLVTDFGAIADDDALDTVALQRALDTASERGGGRVVLPVGTFRSGSLFLRAGVELHLVEGAVLLGSNQLADYPRGPTRIEGKRQEWRLALLNATGLDGVRLTGRGVIDGNGIFFWASFWQRRKEKPNCTNLEVERPRLVFLDECRDVRITGLTFRDSGFWNLHLYRCRDVLIEGVTITAPDSGRIRAPSTDGIDLDSSRDVVIRGCTISVGDDCIALKGTKGPLADQDPASPPVENILIEHCTFGEGHGVLTCGSEATLVRNITLRHCVLTAPNNLLSLKLRPDTPQRYENILIEHIELRAPTGGRIFKVQPWTQFFDLAGHEPPRSHVRGVTIRHVKGRIGTLGILRGHDRATLEDISLENLDLTTTSDTPFDVAPEAGLTLHDVRVNGAALTR